MTGKNGSEYIYASNTVRRAFDPVLLNFLGEKTGKPLLIIGIEEIDISPLRKFWLEHASGLSEKEIKETRKEAIQSNLLRYLYKNNYNHNLFSQNMLDAISRDIDQPAFVRSLAGNTDGYPWGGVIFMRLDITKENLSIPSKSDFKNIPGKDAEWNALFLMHEVGHVLTNALDNPDILEKEIMADQAMIELSKEAYQRGILKTPGLIEAFMGVRALSIFDKVFDDEHVTGPGVRTENEATAFRDSSVLMMSGLNNLRKKVFMAIGDPLMNLGDTGQALKDTLDKGKGALNFIEGDDRELMEAAIARIFSGASLREKEVELMLEPLGETAKFELNRARERVSADKGSFVAQTDPHLRYETVRHMYEAGAFDDNLISKQYAKEFLDAAVKYAPGYFGIQNSPEPKPDPFKRLGADATPTPPDAPALTLKV